MLPCILLARIGLLHKHNIMKPPSFPIFLVPRMVCPCQSKGEIGFSTIQYLLEHPLHKPFSITKPIVPIKETCYSCFTCQRSLLFTHLWNTQVIVAQVGRNLRLVMAFPQRFSLTNVCPFGKSFPPPFIIFLKRIILRQI